MHRNLLQIVIQYKPTTKKCIIIAIRLKDGKHNLHRSLLATKPPLKELRLHQKTRLTLRLAGLIIPTRQTQGAVSPARRRNRDKAVAKSRFLL